MIEITYEPKCHAEYNTLRAHHWGLLRRAGWRVQYDNPIDNKMCGSRATKEFKTLSEGIFEFSDITRVDLFHRGRYYADKRSRCAGKRMSKCVYHQTRPIHYFLVRSETSESKEYDGREVLSVIKSRFSK